MHQKLLIGNKWAGYRLLFCFWALTLSVNAQVDLDRGLIAYYPLDSSTMNKSLNRLSQTDLIATNTSYSSGRNGSDDRDGALYFNGNSQAKLQTPLPTDELTISFWLQTNHTDKQAIFGWEEYGYGARLENGGIMQCYLYEAANHPNYYWHFGSLADHQWHHILLSYGISEDGSESYSYKLYIDGAYVASDKYHLLNKSIHYGKGSLVFGTLPSEQGFIGKIDDILLYNRMLSTAEIGLLAKGAVPNWDEDLQTGQLIYLNFTKGGENQCQNHTKIIEIQENGGRIAKACQNYSWANPMRAFSDKSDGVSIGSIIQSPYFTFSLLFSSDSREPGVIAAWPDGGGYQVMLNPSSNEGRLEVKCWISQDTFYHFISERSVNDGKCHHLALSYDGTLFRIFLDKGIVYEENIVSGSAGIFYENGNFNIGNPNGHLAANAFQGKVDEVRLYNRALSEKEIMRLASGPQAVASISVKNYNRGGSTRSEIAPQSAFVVLKNNTSEKQKFKLQEQKGKRRQIGKFTLQPNEEIVHEFKESLPLDGLKIEN